MDLFHLWFIKYDSFFFNNPPNYLQLRKIIRYHYKELSQCNQTNIQLHLYELVKFIDYFFNLQNIIELLQYHIEQQIVLINRFTQNQLYDIEQKTIQFRIMIECEKIYCEQFWLNKKLNWDVQVRILSSICRIYFFITKVHYFLVGQNKNLWQISKLKKLFIPIEHWEKFVNQVYIKLHKLDNFYYQYQYPFIKQIHELLSSFKILLHDFPNLYHRQIQKQFALFDIIINENKKYLWNFRTKLLEQRQNYHQHYTNSKITRKTKSLQHQKSKIFEIDEYYMAFNFKLQKKYSLQNYHLNPLFQQISNIQKKFSPMLFENIQRKKKISNSNLKNSISQYASTRARTTTRDMSQSFTSKQSSLLNRTKQYSLFNQQIKVKTRRTSMIHKYNGIKLLEKSFDKILIQFDLNFIQEKEQKKLSLRIFYNELPFPNSSHNPIKISVKEEQSATRKLKYEGLASKQKFAQKKLKQLFQDSHYKLSKKKLLNYNKICI